MINEFHANTVQKLGEKGWAYHTRLLICDDYTLAYYRKVPKEFMGNPPLLIILETRNLPSLPRPKMKINLKFEETEICRIEEEEIRRKKKLNDETCFSVKFLEGAINEGRVRGKKNLDGKYVWYFRVESSEDRDNWINVQTGGDQTSYMPEIMPYHRPDNSDEGDDQSEKKLHDDFQDESSQNYLLEDQDSDEELEEKKEYIEDKAQKEQANIYTQNILEEIQNIHGKQQKLFEKKQKKEARSWDLKFQKYWGKVITSNQSDMEESIKYSERLIDHLGKFRRSSEFYTRLLINEFHKPINKRKYKPISLPLTIPIHPLLYSILCDNDPEPRLYLINKLIIKITTKEEFVNISGGASQTIFKQNKWKLFARQFMTMDVLFDALFITQKQPDFKLRIPLCSHVDYKGFRALVIGYIPICSNPKPPPTLATGLPEFNLPQFNQAAYSPFPSTGVKKQLSYISEVLNIQAHKFTYKNELQPEIVELSPLVEVHRRYLGEEPLSEEEIIDENPFGTGGDLQRGIGKQIDFHFHELDYDEDIYYILKTQEIFPLDLNIMYLPKGGIDIKGKGKADFSNYLRPEFLVKYPKSLRSDLLNPRITQLREPSDFHDMSEQGLNDLKESKKYLERVVLPGLAEDFDSLDIIPIDSKTLTQAFHSQGVNMRYLGQVCSMCTLSHVKEFCETEMIARTAKNLLLEQLADLITNHGLEGPSSAELLLEESDSYLIDECDKFAKTSEDFILADYDQKKYYDNLIQDGMHSYLLECLRDYLNMIFGDTEETSTFWKNVLIPEASRTFMYPIADFEKANFNQNAILFALIDHTGLDIDFEAQTPIELGKSENPFKKGHIREIRPKSKAYGLRVIPYQVLGERFGEYRAAGKNNLALKALHTKMTMTKYLENTVDINALAEIADILLEENDIRQCMLKAEESLRHIPKNHAQAVKSHCILARAAYIGNLSNDKVTEHFEHATNILTQHWGQFHPLHSTIYNIEAQLIINHQTGDQLKNAEFLYCASQKLCEIVLGPNHLRTAELYMDFGKLYLKMENTKKLQDISRSDLKKDQMGENNLKNLALANFEKAFYIYESNSKENGKEMGWAGFEITMIMVKQRRFIEALPYAQRSAEIYRHLYGQTHIQYITCLWIVVTISYSLFKHKLAEKYCKLLYKSLRRREQSTQEELENPKWANSKHPENQRIELEIGNTYRESTTEEKEEQKILELKELCTAASILILTRTLTLTQKIAMRKVGEMVFSKEIAAEESQIEGDKDDGGHIISIKKKPLIPIPLKVVNLNKLSFIEYEEGRESKNIDARYFLREYYRQSKTYADGVFGNFLNLIEKITKYYRNLDSEESYFKEDHENYGNISTNQFKDEYIFINII